MPSLTVFTHFFQEPELAHSPSAVLSASWQQVTEANNYKNLEVSQCQR
jgi:hypothetical protein